MTIHNVNASQRAEKVSKKYNGSFIVRCQCDAAQCILVIFLEDTQHDYFYFTSI